MRPPSAIYYSKNVLSLSSKLLGVQQKAKLGSSYYHFDLGPKRFLNEVPSQQQTLLLLGR